MPRYRIPIVALAGNAPIANASMQVRNRDTAAVQTVYVAETGGAVLTVAQQVSDAYGRFPGWTDAPQPLEATVTPPAGTGLAPWIEQWDASPAGPGDVVPPWLDAASLVPGANTVTLAMLVAAIKASGTATDADEAVRALGLTAGKAAPGVTVAEMLAVPRTVIQMAARHGALTAGAVKLLLPTHNNETTGANDRDLSNGYQGAFWLPAPPAITGKVAKLRLCADMIGNGAFAGVTTMIARLHAVTAAAGGLTLGTQIATATPINGTTPADGAPNHDEGAWVNHPAAGLYAVTVTPNANTPAMKSGARVELNYQ